KTPLALEVTFLHLASESIALDCGKVSGSLSEKISLSEYLLKENILLSLLEKEKNKILSIEAFDEVVIQPEFSCFIFNLCVAFMQKTIVNYPLLHLVWDYIDHQTHRSISLYEYAIRGRDVLREEHAAYSRNARNHKIVQFDSSTAQAVAQYAYRKNILLFYFSFCHYIFYLVKEMGHKWIYHILLVYLFAQKIPFPHFSMIPYAQ
ncbi:hypothetical protein ACJX0J_037140, partial [Zea mays]